MGFSAIPPSPNQATAVASLEMWRTRADAAIMHVDVQWAAMLSGIAAGRRITEPAIQRLYRDYVVAIVDVVRPVYVGLAAETNLIRAAAPRPVYDGWCARQTTRRATSARAASRRRST